MALQEYFIFRRYHTLFPSRFSDSLLVFYKTPSFIFIRALHILFITNSLAGSQLSFLTGTISIDSNRCTGGTLHTLSLFSVLERLSTEVALAGIYAIRSLLIEMIRLSRPLAAQL